MFYPSVQDHVGMNLSVLPNAYFSCMHINCSQIIKINKIHSYGFYEYEAINNCQNIDHQYRFIWENAQTNRLGLFFNLTKEEVEFANSRGTEDPNAMLDLISISKNLDFHS